MADDNERGGQVVVDKAKIAATRQGGATVLLHVPSNKFVSVNEAGAQIWDLVQDGANAVDAIVEQHAKRNGVSASVAAYQVLTFFEELAAQGFADVRLAKGTQSPPLLDVPLDPASLPAGFQPALSTAKRVITLDSPRPNLTIGDARKLAETVSGRTLTDVARTHVLEVPAPVSLDQIAKAAASGFGSDPSIREVAALDRPSENLRVDNLRALEVTGTATVDAGSGGAGPRVLARAARIVVVIVIITDDTIIIIVVSTGGGGPSAGKSRQSCKTMCV